MNVVYICYFGLGENLVQTQVVPYLSYLVSKGHRITLLTYEPDLANEYYDKTLRNYCLNLKNNSIQWHSLKYHKRPTHIATLFDIAAGLFAVIKIHRETQIHLIHARSHIPLIIALFLKAVLGCKVLFDIRGLLADEYVDAGVWRPHSLTYKLIKFAESIGVKTSDGLIVLTEKMRNYLVNAIPALNAKITVIPCCVASHSEQAFEAVKSQKKDQIKFTKFEVVYAGSVTGLYLLEEIAQFFKHLVLIIPQATISVLTGSKMHSHVNQVFNDIGIDSSKYSVFDVPPYEIPLYLLNATVGISFRKPTFSQIAASPTKIPEYLMAGIPVITNAGIGDTDDLISANNVGVVLTNFTDSDYKAALSNLQTLLQDPQLRIRCRKVARDHFDLAAIGGERYRLAYNKIEKLIN